MFDTAKKIYYNYREIGLFKINHDYEWLKNYDGRKNVRGLETLTSIYHYSSNLHAYIESLYSIRHV